MKKFWFYSGAVLVVTTVLSWSNMSDSTERLGSGRHGSTWSSNTGGGSWGGGGGHK